ncbi:MAG: ammonium transporter [Spirochaetales bacterium]|nr:ammonium transporter [Spirochaetales bacterium]
MGKKSVIFTFFLFLLILISVSNIFADSSLNIDEIEKRIDLIKTDLDYVWVILGAALVFFMQAGFMALESGMARSKNSINVAIKNLTDFVLGVIGFWAIGFGIMFGKSKMGLFGTSDFLVSIKDPWTAAFFMFQSVFVGTAATIDSGAICGRAKLKQYILISFLVSIVVYPVFGHWAWGSFLHGTDPLTGGAGWLEAMGFKDFAGSSVVHSVGGWIALAGVIVVGPRIGRFEIDPKTGKNGKALKIHPGDMRFVFLGTFILFFGWFGFNCGSTLAASPDIAVIALNTTLSACFGCLASSLLSWMFHPEKKIEGDMIANGVLAGLVGITAGCAYVNTTGAVIIGTVAGILVYTVSLFMERVLKLDDVVGAVPVHGVCGAWGTFAVGLFITKDNLGEMTRLQQIQVQSLGVGVCFLWAFIMGLLLYFLVDKLFGGVRVSKEEEIMGLNIAEHGATSSIIELANAMDDLTKSGDFSEGSEVKVEQGTEIGELAGLFNQMIVKVQDALRESHQQKVVAEAMLKDSEFQKRKVMEAQEALKKQSEESSMNRCEYLRDTKNKVSTINSGIEDVKELMSKTSMVSQDMSSSFQKLIETLSTMLENTNNIYNRLSEVDSITESTSKTTISTKMNVNELNAITKEISDMVTLINDIADKTHVLSINSGIEAARTGEAGKGFVIISKEIRDLSHQTAETADKIGVRLQEVNEKVEAVTGSLEQILGIVNEISNLNSAVVDIVNNSKTISQDLKTQSQNTVKVVTNVIEDIDEVVNEAGHLSNIGQQVENDLDSVE